MSWLKRSISVFLTVVMIFSLAACSGQQQGEYGKQDKQEDTITVYLSNASFLSEYAPYIQKQLPDVDIDFIVGRDTVDFYEFLQQNNDLPDIMMVGALSLRDSSELNPYLMDLSRTDAAASYHNSYLELYRSGDKSIRWMPAGGVVHGILANKDLFDEYDILLPVDYDSFVSACDKFAQYGIRGFTSDYKYDYTCLYTLEGWSIPQLMGAEGLNWTYDYANGVTDELYKPLWTKIFEKAAKVVKDVGITAEDTGRGYSMTLKDLEDGKLAMLRGTTSDIEAYSHYGKMVMLPYFGSEEEENWIMTEPAFHVALSGSLEDDAMRRSKALKVLDVMLSVEAIETLADEYLYIHSYSSEGILNIPAKLANLKPEIEANRIYISQPSSKLFPAALEGLQGIITGKYNGAEAYAAANEVFLEAVDESVQGEIVYTQKETYSSQFINGQGKSAASAMANTMRIIAGTDVLLAPSFISTGSFYEGDYTLEQLDSMFQSSGNRLFTCSLTGAELSKLISIMVEGYGAVTDPFNPETLPVASGMEITVEKVSTGYMLGKVTVDGTRLKNTDVYTVALVDVPERIQALTGEALGPNRFETFTSSGDTYARMLWLDYLMEGNEMEKPTAYISVTGQ